MLQLGPQWENWCFWLKWRTVYSIKIRFWNMLWSNSYSHLPFVRVFAVLSGYLGLVAVWEHCSAESPEYRERSGDPPGSDWISILLPLLFRRKLHQTSSVSICDTRGHENYRWQASAFPKPLSHLMCGFDFIRNFGFFPLHTVHDAFPTVTELQSFIIYLDVFVLKPLVCLRCRCELLD